MLFFMYFRCEDEKLSSSLDYLPSDRDSPVAMVNDPDTGQDEDCTCPLSAQKSFLMYPSCCMYHNFFYIYEWKGGVPPFMKFT